MHRLDVLDELGKEGLHTLGNGAESMDLVRHAAELSLFNVALDLEVLCVSL